MGLNVATGAGGGGGAGSAGRPGLGPMPACTRTRAMAARSSCAVSVLGAPSDFGPTVGAPTRGGCAGRGTTFTTGSGAPIAARDASPRNTTTPNDAALFRMAVLPWGAVVGQAAAEGNAPNG